FKRVELGKILTRIHQLTGRVILPDGKRAPQNKHRQHQNKRDQMVAFSIQMDSSLRLLEFGATATNLTRVDRYSYTSYWFLNRIKNA
ncbi:hypothetical protein N9B39_01675, partial [bacterium]|nr:hypothetical protein [bacterium]